MGLLRTAVRILINHGPVSLFETTYDHLARTFVTPDILSLRSQIIKTPVIWGDENDVAIHETAILNDALLNSRSGKITIKKHTFFGHDVKVLTGEHDYTRTGEDRIATVVDDGNDIIIERGVWVASGAIIVGPCHIGENAVICAGSVVTSDVEANTVYGGNPAEFIKEIT